MLNFIPNLAFTMKKPNKPNIKEYQSFKNEKGEVLSWTTEDCGRFSDDMRDYQEKLSEYNRVLNESKVITVVC